MSLFSIVFYGAVMMPKVQKPGTGRPKSIPPPDVPYTRVPQTLLRQVMRKVSGAELAILMVVIDKTYGWDKAEDTISYSQFEELTGLAHSTVINTVEKLVADGYLTCRAGRKYKGKERIYSYKAPPPPLPEPVDFKEKKSKLEQLKELYD